MCCSGQGSNSRLPSETGQIKPCFGERALLLVGSGRPASDPVSTMFRCKDVRRGHANGDDDNDDNDDGNSKLPACAVLHCARGKRSPGIARTARPPCMRMTQVPSPSRARRKHGYVAKARLGVQSFGPVCFWLPEDNTIHCESFSFSSRFYENHFDENLIKST